MLYLPVDNHPKLKRYDLDDARKMAPNQCPKCRSVPNSQILCCKSGNSFRLNHNREPTVSAMPQRNSNAQPRAAERGCLIQGIRSYSNLPAAMTMPKSSLLHPLLQPAMKSFVTRVTFQSPLTFTCSECHRVIRKSSPRATCTTCGQSRYLVGTYLPRQERESIRDGCREWRCCGIAQYPFASAIPSQDHPTPSQISESTILQEVQVIHLKTKEDGLTTQPNQ